MKIVKFIGGLGNQMFQYAFYLSMKENNSDIYADTYGYQAGKFHQGFELEKIFNITIPIAGKEYIKKLAFFECGMASKLFKKIYIPQKTHYYEKKIGFDNCVPGEGDWYYEGYWQSEKYFQNIGNKIRQTYIFPEFRDKLNLECYQRIVNCNAVAIHVRRTDFLSNRNSHFINLGTSNYYRDAIQLVNKQFAGDFRLFVFSDDMDWAQMAFKDYSCIYVDWNKGAQSFRDMQLMSNCKAIVVANSSFSWWGAYLNPRNVDKIVVAPKEWYSVATVAGREIKSSDINVHGWWIV